MEEVAGPGVSPAAKWARTGLFVIAGAMALQLLFNLINSLLGGSYPFTWFGFYRDDRWADFFKMAFAYSGDPIHEPIRAWPSQPHIDHLHELADGYHGSNINPDHMPPVETFLAVLVRRGFSLMDPFLLFQGVLWAVMLSLAATISAFGPKGEWRWVAAAFLTYPVWYMFDRGHFLSTVCAISLLAGCRRLLAGEGRFDGWAIFLLALACNMRPNVVLLPALLVLSGKAGRFRDLVALGIAGAVMLEVAMIAASWLSPHYGWSTWISGLIDYNRVYVIKPLGRGFTTSLPSAMTLLFGYHRVFGLLGQALGAATLLAALVAGRKGRLGTAEISFVALGAMVLSTPALGDYHLLPFLLPLLLLGREDRPLQPGETIVAVASFALLIPKNYIYGSAHPYDPWSIQVVANPLLVLVAVIAVLALAYRPVAVAEPATA